MGLWSWLFGGSKGSAKRPARRPGTKEEMQELYFAVADGRVDRRSSAGHRSLKELLALGFDINAPAPTIGGGTTYVIRESVGAGDSFLSVTKLLVDHGADLHRLYDGETLLARILDREVYCDNDATIAYLRAKGVKE